MKVSIRNFILNCLLRLVVRFFGGYEYSIIVSDHINLEKIMSEQKPRFTFILGGEDAEIYNKGRDIKNRVLVNGVITKVIESGNLAHCLGEISDIEKMKTELLGIDKAHKGSVVYGHVKMDDDMPNFSAEHQITLMDGVTVLRAQFSIVLEIFNEG